MSRCGQPSAKREVLILFVRLDLERTDFRFAVDGDEPGRNEPSCGVPSRQAHHGAVLVTAHRKIQPLHPLPQFALPIYSRPATALANRVPVSSA